VFLFFVCVNCLGYFLSCFMLDLQMSSSSSVYVGYVDGASCSTQNIASTAWVIFSPTDELVSSGGVYLGPATNNIAEYSVVIELLSEALTLGIHHFVIDANGLIIWEIVGSYVIDVNGLV
jgi:hypothetical protein